MAFSTAEAYSKLQAILTNTTSDVLPRPDAIAAATKAIVTSVPQRGLGESAVEQHLLNDLIPGFQGQKTGSNYYGFVTGGTLPIAEMADNVVTAYDQNTSVHLPDQSINTTVEDAALRMLIELLDLKTEDWQGRTFTTGATASNILGLACAREAVISRRLKAKGIDGGVGELGLLKACELAGVKEIQILTSLGHSSLYKAASVIGLGRNSVKELPDSAEETWRMNLQKLEKKLQECEHGVASIVSISAGEINTGLFATDSNTMSQIRTLCDKYNAWLHVDGAFGLFARALPHTEEFGKLRTQAAGLELADSITGDCHKLLNVPYDCGFFLTRTSAILSDVFQNPNAAYLASGASSIPTPLNIGLENSRRFRALPVYSVLLAYGIEGFQDIFVRQARLARAVAKFLQESKEFELLPMRHDGRDRNDYGDVHISVLFRANNEALNAVLSKKINDTRKIYVSGTKWEDRPACRIAVSTWKVDVERDIKIIIEVLEGVLQH